MLPIMNSGCSRDYNRGTEFMKELVEAIRAAAAPGHTEEDLKLAMESFLREHLRRQKTEGGSATVSSSEARTGLAGRRDAVYGHFTLEYKRPGYLAHEQNLQRAAQQLSGYLQAAAGEAKDGEALERVAGACTDGRHIFFMRYWPKALLHVRQRHPRLMSLFGTDAASGGFQVLGPYPITESSLKELFRYLRSLGRRPLVAEALAEVFGPGSDPAKQVAVSLHSAFAVTKSNRVDTLYRQWERVFGVAYGEDAARAERDVPDLARGYALPEGVALRPSLFVVHSYFALIMKLLAAEFLALQGNPLSRSLLTELPGLDSSALRDRLVRLEAGEDYRAYGIHSFLEEDFFLWYLDAWDESIGESLQALARSLSDFEPATPTLRPGETRDLLKTLYQHLVLKQLRHNLGEYYTPDWIAERLLNQLGYDGDPDTRLLDPACGSGTFLTLALARVREKVELELQDGDPKQREICARKILNSVVGFDLNPLAVIAARTNYLLAFGDLLRHARPVEIPVYNCDAILAPVLQRQARKGKNGVWDMLLKNSFAPVLQEPFDLIVGNPPWVNWEHLPQSWRELSKELWARYGLFSLKGYEQLLGGAKPDISMLFTYACADHYLRHKGQLGFVITQTVFKTKGAGDGFRRFRLGEDGPHLRVRTVDDLSHLQPFEGATNRTAILTLVKGEPTRYPVSYTLWERKRRQRITLESTLQEASERSRQRNYFAEPVNAEEPTSPWITASRYVLSALRKVIGPSSYRAYEGANTGGLNGVYWVRILEERPNGLVVIENLGNIGKKKVSTVRATVEPELLYPLVRGRDVQPWKASSEVFLLLPQDCMQGMGGYPESIMRTRFPGAHAYLKRFEEQLRERSGFKRYFRPKKDPFWSMYAVGPYTLAPYKVVWREQARVLTCAVVSSSSFLREEELKVVVPDRKAFFVPTDCEEEAGFIAALLGSRIAQMVAKSYALETSISAHLIQHIRIPPFDHKTRLHRDLAVIAGQLRCKPDSVKDQQDEVDRLAAELWGLSDTELQAIIGEIGPA